MIRGFYVRGHGALADYVGMVVEDAATYAQRYQDVLSAYPSARRRRFPDVPTKGGRKLIGDYEAYFGKYYGRGGARAAVAYAAKSAEFEMSQEQLRRAKTLAKRRGKRAERALSEHSAAKALRPITPADRLVMQHLRPFQGTKSISATLHGEALVNSREATRVVLRSIRESETLSRAARELDEIQRHAGQNTRQRGAGFKGE